MHTCVANNSSVDAQIFNMHGFMPKSLVAAAFLGVTTNKIPDT
jgi:hypothetical protein